MKKLLIIFAILLVVFIGLWTFKLNTPLMAADPFANGISESQPWWELRPNEAPPTDDEWILDPEIPANYIPVLGADELYMVIGEDGSIIEYRHRVRQPDGSWLWETVNPDIPSNYEPVPGLEDVYKVTDRDGNVRYYKYHRNSDDTYYFEEVDENGNPIKKDKIPVNENGIPANYVLIPGTNIYAVYNEYGVIIGYKERIKNPDGTYGWRDCAAPISGNGSQSGSGKIPGYGIDLQENNTGMVVIIDQAGNKKGYEEKHTTTELKHIGNETIVYETIVVYTYDDKGNLISTKKTGPTEINRFPTTEINEQILPKS